MHFKHFLIYNCFSKSIFFLYIQYSYPSLYIAIIVCLYFQNYIMTSGSIYKDRFCICTLIYFINQNDLLQIDKIFFFILKFSVELTIEYIIYI